ncbi:alpha/beta hydrolase fold protein [Catenulispora acidiphila DSM 44928]|uniref:Alpha/beta hydrolase fold protein n=1 Tax=Catenulispora acidiphila (strain DSM 44928 / JCM 14897 / NBRC 102108 / NRRL B-24433 / ID139908) TaxID=479433 RepID=C7Q1D2_CATAD|nr:alpha/beta hydrolase [Catenulispora acidiphila]ACU73661.1 alpha/beta hydrolase fold protein [Catenulispora acidiphila DSM 44928]
MRAYHVTIGAYEFTATEEGPQAGPPVVLLHGFPQTSASWQAASRLLAADGLRTIALDQRGYSPGARPLEVSEYHVNRLVQDVVGLLDALHLPSAHLVGHDWGAIVAWHAAVAHPDRFRTLTAVSVPHLKGFYEVLADPGPEGEDQRRRSEYVQLFRMDDKPEDVLLANSARALHDLFSPLPESAILPHYGALGQRPALTAALNWYRAIDVKQSAALANVRIPTTFVWSTEDVAIGRAVAENCAQCVEGPYRFVELNGVSHWIPDQAPVELARAVVDRVRSVDN